MLDGPVLSGRVHCLEDQKHRPTVLRVKLVLLLGEPFHTAREQLLRLRLRLGAEAARVGGIEIPEAEALAADDFVRLDETADLADDFLAGHDRLPGDLAEARSLTRGPQGALSPRGRRLTALARVA